MTDITQLEAALSGEIAAAADPAAFKAIADKVRAALA